MTTKWINQRNVTKKYNSVVTNLLLWIAKEDTPMQYKAEKAWERELKAVMADGLVESEPPANGWSNVLGINWKAMRAAGLASKEACETWDTWEAEQKEYWAQFAN
jgi:hypothetical protein